MKKIIGILFAGLLICTLCIPALATEMVSDIIIGSCKTYTVDSDVMLIDGNQIMMWNESILSISERGFLSGVNTELSLVGLNQKIELKDGGGLYLEFNDGDQANAFCKILTDSGIAFNRNGNAIQAGVCKHADGTHTVCRQCGKPVPGAVGSILSEGSMTVICSVGCLAVGFLAAMLIFRKKKPAPASGNTDEE